MLSILEDDVLFDKLIRLELYKKTAESWDVIDIDAFSCDDLKPGIFMSMTMIQGGVATELKVVVENFTPPTDIGEYTTMVITAGYRSKFERRQFTCSIFSSYPETPNPNGKMVFNGIVGNWFINNLRESARNIIFKKPYVSIAELLYGIIEGRDAEGKQESPDIKGGGLNLKLIMDLPDWVKRDKLYVGGEGNASLTYWTESGYACLNWLMDKISLYSNELVAMRRNEGKPDAESYRILMWLDDDTVRVSMKGFTGQKDDDRVRWIDLNRVTTVSFQGTALNVIAPWNPSLVPGDLFHMESRYFRGRLSTQSILKAAKDPDDLYRVITMDVSFDTNGSNNTMKILSVKNAAFLQEKGLVEEATALEKVPEEMQTLIYVDENPDRDIIFGTDKTETEEQIIITKAWGVGANTFQESDGTIRKVKAGETLASIAEEVYGSIEYIKTDADGNTEHKNEKVTGTSFWPIIAIGTQCMYLRGLQGFEDYETHPDLLLEGRNVFIPTMTNPDDLSNLSSIISNMADNWEQLPQFTGFFVDQADIDSMRLLAYFMEL